jgi:hypothetical protein
MLCASARLHSGVSVCLQPGWVLPLVMVWDVCWERGAVAGLVSS